MVLIITTIPMLLFREGNILRRLGLLSGKVYTDDDYRNGNIQECCFVIPREFTEQDIKDEYEKRNHFCQVCRKCPAATKQIKH